jgi:small nuclear ribonucleoprotein (snRNP)-like protein
MDSGNEVDADTESMDIKDESMTGLKKKKEIEESEKVQQLRGYLDSTMKVTMTDGRTLVGTFTCVDKCKNIILAGCQETSKYGACPFSFLFSFFPFYLRC